MFVSSASTFNTNEMRLSVHIDQLTTYRTALCAISFGAFGVACDSQSNCTTASRLLPR